MSKRVRNKRLFMDIAIYSSVLFYLYLLGARYFWRCYSRSTPADILSAFSQNFWTFLLLQLFGVLAFTGGQVEILYASPL